MFPNQSNPVSQFPDKANNNQLRPPPSFAPNLQQPQYANQGFLNPQAQSFNPNRNVYASTIQLSTSSSNPSKQGFSGLSKL